MKLRTALVLGALAALLAPASALAKGASEATITGPGLGDGITLAGEGEANGEQLGQLAETAGFFMAVYGSYPSTLEDARPKGELGPRYTIEYTMPGPNNELDVIVQDLYPYANPSPVTYMPAGQRFFTTERTIGGWFVASALLKDQLIAAGLPQSPPGGSPDDGGAPWTVVALVTVVTALAALAALLFRSRRRSQPAPA